MNKTLLLVIDVQKNFINENTEFLIEKIDNLIQSKTFDLMAFTKFINEENSPFYKILNYKGCLSEADRKIVLNVNDHKVFEKTKYTAINAEFLKFIKVNNISTVYLCGIDTDACVMKNALDLFEQNIKVKVLKDYSMSHSGIDYHNAAIKILQKLIGKDNVI